MENFDECTFLIKEGKYLRINYSKDIDNDLKKEKYKNTDTRLFYIIWDNVMEQVYEMFKKYHITNDYFEHNQEIIDYFAKHSLMNECHISVNTDMFADLVFKVRYKRSFSVFFASINKIEKDNDYVYILRVNSDYVKFITNDLHIVASTVHRLIKDLCNAEILIKIKNGLYQVNPALIRF